MESTPLQLQIANMKQSFFDEGYLDDFFIQVEELASKENPYFAEEIFTLFFRDNRNLLNGIEQEMEKPAVDFVGLDRMLHQLKGTSSSIGATRIKDKADETRGHCKNADLESAKVSFRGLKVEFDTLKEKLELYFQMLRQADNVEKGMPPKWRN